MEIQYFDPDTDLRSQRTSQCTTTQELQVPTQQATGCPTPITDDEDEECNDTQLAQSMKDVRTQYREIFQELGQYHVPKGHQEVQPPISVDKIKKLDDITILPTHRDSVYHWWYLYQHLAVEEHESLGFICYAHVLDEDHCCRPVGGSPAHYCPEHLAKYGHDPCTYTQDVILGQDGPSEHHFPPLISTYHDYVREHYPKENQAWLNKPQLNMLTVPETQTGALSDASADATVSQHVDSDDQSNYVDLTTNDSQQNQEVKESTSLSQSYDPDEYISVSTATPEELKHLKCTCPARVTLPPIEANDIGFHQARCPLNMQFIPPSQTMTPPPNICTCDKYYCEYPKGVFRERLYIHRATCPLAYYFRETVLKDNDQA